VLLENHEVAAAADGAAVSSHVNDRLGFVFAETDGGQFDDAWEVAISRWWHEG
jgi:hypothetical protein